MREAVFFCQACAMTFACAEDDVIEMGITEDGIVEEGKMRCPLCEFDDTLIRACVREVKEKQPEPAPPEPDQA